METLEKVCVIGLGYIGLPTAALLANRGYQVHGVDVLPEVVETINSGNVHIIEPGLHTFVKSAVLSGRLTAHLEPTESDIFMIAVPTPLMANNQPNVDYVIQATESIVPYLKPGNMVILESTSPVGTTEQVLEVIQKNGVDTDSLYIAYCPERVLPGKTMIELVENDRIVGGINEASAAKVKAFYSTFVEGEILTTNARTSEMSKLTENAFRDVNIAFANELSIICDQLDINVWELISLANHHPRVNILQPGSGVGGHCIAVDPWFIISRVNEAASLMRTAREKNLYKTDWVIDKVKSMAADHMTQTGQKPKIACMGLAFKPDIDDLRESPALEITKALKEGGYDVIPVEPNIAQYKDWELQTPEAAVAAADLVVFLVAHAPFKKMLMGHKPFLDVCGVFK